LAAIRQDKVGSIEAKMSISIQIPAMLRNECEGRNELRVSARTVREALAQLERNHPALYRSVCDETGAVRRHMNLFVNSSLVRGGQGLDTALATGDVLFIMTAVSGG
jgi:molybdopterin converting factor small subunit